MILFSILAVIFGVILRVSVSLNSYSGEGKGPMFGDYEAQRHWMEVTYNLPINQWYVNSSENDLLYWGLDYPPLTAYHSFICGWIAHKINPTWVALKESRGHESYYHKLFMRYTVLVADLLIYIPAVFYFTHKKLAYEGPMKKAMALGTALAYPGLILIDHGHFQYNCVSLGFTLWGIIFLMKRREVLGSAAFVLALNYKQMELYHALPFFFYLLGLCVEGPFFSRDFKNLTRVFASIFDLSSIAVPVIATFALCWLPFLRDVESALNVLKRLFPFARGLYEDKVANVWCSVAVFIKLKNFIDISYLVPLCAITTLVACWRSSVDLFLNPYFDKFRLSLINCSLAFFLFSFQVHEKSILIAALPVMLCLPDAPFFSTWFLLISTFSMFPLLERDGQGFSYLGLMVIFYTAASQTYDIFSGVGKGWKVAFSVSIGTGVMLHLAKMMIPPPAKLPDLFPVLFSLFSGLHFVSFFLYCNYIQCKGISYRYVEVEVSWPEQKKGN